LAKIHPLFPQTAPNPRLPSRAGAGTLGRLSREQLQAALDLIPRAPAAAARSQYQAQPVSVIRAPVQKQTQEVPGTRGQEELEAALEALLLGVEKRLPVEAVQETSRKHFAPEPTAHRRAPPKRATRQAEPEPAPDATGHPNHNEGEPSAASPSWTQRGLRIIVDLSILLGVLLICSLGLGSKMALRIVDKGLWGVGAYLLMAGAALAWCGSMSALLKRIARLFDHPRVSFLRWLVTPVGGSTGRGVADALVDFTLWAAAAEGIFLAWRLALR
jgi:hypothetical protein